MQPSEKRYIIGIDLGTTNSAVSCVDLMEGDEDRKKRIRIFRVPQPVAEGETGYLPVLPSFLYIPGEYDLPENAVSIPWEQELRYFAGAFARDHGARIPARLVSSAKSWLCHSRADRRARILPWGAKDEVKKVSPVEATAAYLSHIRHAWNSGKGEDADLYLENQSVIITIPASFDEVARDLTLEAAEMAGIFNVTLLEEPLAAFYNWLIRNENSWSDTVSPNELILVCDVGGGTTDFTLITLRESEGSPRFERIAVGDHLILGGDNIDLALARRIEAKMSGKSGKAALTPDRWKALCHQCRQAKESILNQETDEKKITLMGGGGKLISGTLSATLNREMVFQTVLEGFFPIVDKAETKAALPKEAITEFGLPYASDPAVTRHIGEFLMRHQKDVENILEREDLSPDWILFNGGSLKSREVRSRILSAVAHWFKKEESQGPKELENPEPDLSVALGAAYYGLVKMGKGVRVGSGSPRAYYLGVAKKTEEVKPDTAICLVERGLDEGSVIALPGKEFEVLANRPVGFDVFSSSFRSGDRAGDILPVDDTLTALPPLRTIIHYGKKGVEARIPVTVEASYTEMGTLALWCRSNISEHKWRLNFQLRSQAQAGETKGGAGMPPAEESVFDEKVVEEVKTTVDRAFSQEGDKQALDSLVKDMASILETQKENWPLPLIREIADVLLKKLPLSGCTPAFESRFYNLLGFCMRPGFGEGFDEGRMNAVWKMYNKGPEHEKNPQVRAEWWILFRRVAGGFSHGRQRQLIQNLSPFMLLKKKEKSKIPPTERMEIWMAAANMERLTISDKVKWGEALLKEMTVKHAKPKHFWALSRFGARELLYGPVDRVVPPEKVIPWINTLLSVDYKDPGPVCTALVQLSAKTGDRVRDIPEDTAARVVDFLKRNAGDPLPVLEVVERKESDQNQIFGESLPAGLSLLS